MKDIKYLKTGQVMIFPVDDIYFSGLNNENAIQKIITTFSLNKAPSISQLPIQLPQLVFQNGLFTHEKKIYVIEQLLIEERRIVTNIQSSSNISEIFYNNLKDLLLSLDLRDQKGTYEPLINAFETICTLNLNIKMNKLINNINTNSLLQLFQKRKQTHGATVSFEPYSIRFNISYNNLPDKLLKNKITISDKPLLIEIRDKTDPNDQIFFTSSPTDSETHFELLKSVENMLK